MTTVDQHHYVGVQCSNHINSPPFLVVVLNADLSWSNQVTRKALSGSCPARPPENDSSKILGDVSLRIMETFSQKLVPSDSDYQLLQGEWMHFHGKSSSPNSRDSTIPTKALSQVCSTKLCSAVLDLGCNGFCWPSTRGTKRLFKVHRTYTCALHKWPDQPALCCILHLTSAMLRDRELNSVLVSAPMVDIQRIQLFLNASARVAIHAANVQCVIV